MATKLIWMGMEKGHFVSYFGSEKLGLFPLWFHKGLKVQSMMGIGIWPLKNIPTCFQGFDLSKFKDATPLDFVSHQENELWIETPIWLKIRFRTCLKFNVVCNFMKIQFKWLSSISIISNIKNNKFEYIMKSSIF